MKIFKNHGGATTLAQCRAKVKALKVMSDTKVDQIFDNPSILY